MLESRSNRQTTNVRYRACSALLGSAHLHSGVLGIFEALYDKECCDALDSIIGQCLCVFTVAPLLCTTLSLHDYRYGNTQ